MKINKIVLLFTFLALSICAKGENEAAKIAKENYRKYAALQQTEQLSAEKKEAIQRYRESYKESGHRTHSFSKLTGTFQDYKKQLTSSGQFADFVEIEHELLRNTPVESKVGGQGIFGKHMVAAWARLAFMAQQYSKGKAIEEMIINNDYLQSIVYYGNFEISRENISSRFHASCFAIPTCAVNIYFYLLAQMERCEKGELPTANVDAQLMKQACDMLKTVALQAWSQPFRNDETDADLTSIERFRNHVWWVGGNALAYRSLLPVAFMYQSDTMIALMADVAQKALSVTSQTTSETSFWTEGITADGAGWGHGMQCLVWGYPVHGTCSALDMLCTLKNSPWEKNLSTQNKQAMFTYLRGSSWLYHKGFELPCLGRTSMNYNKTPRKIGSQQIIKMLLKDWKSSFTNNELAEIQKLDSEMDAFDIQMHGYPQGEYMGTRWFFNNDKLVKKNTDYNLVINMASYRCDGLESSPTVADAYNFCTTDGSTLFQKTGNEYMNAFGAWDALAFPGVTARKGMDQLTSVTNWRGYCSKHNFAGAATRGSHNAVAAYVFEKINATLKEGVNDKGNNIGKNPILYGVKAYKSYFVLGDYMVALGAGITDLNKTFANEIHTTMEQTNADHPIFMIHKNKKTRLVPGKHNLKSGQKPIWIQQTDKFAYTVLPTARQSAFCEISSKKTNWGKINAGNKKTKNLPDSVDVLSLWINHGAHPENDKYEYAVFMGNGMPAENYPFKVLKNTISLQAVKSTDNSVIQAVFYVASAVLKTDRKEIIKVSVPCVLMLENTESGRVLTVNDPCVDKQEVKVSINNVEYKLQFVQGEQAGKSVSITL